MLINSEKELVGIAPGRVFAKIRQVGGLNVIIVENVAVFYTDDWTKYKQIALPGWVMNNPDGDFVLTPDKRKLILCGHGSNDFGKYIHEFSITYDAAGLPVSATAMFTPKPFAASSGGARIVVLPSGVVLAITCRHTLNDNSYNNSVAMRTIGGVWSFVDHPYGEPIAGAFGIEAELGNDGAAWVYMTNDGSHRIALARIREQNGSIIFADFRSDFLADGDERLAPHPEIPNMRLSLDRQHNNRHILTYQTSYDSKWIRDASGKPIYFLAHPTVAGIDSLSDSGNAPVLSVRPNWQSVEVVYQSVPGVKYELFVSLDNVNWAKLTNPYTFMGYPKTDDAGVVTWYGSNPVYHEPPWPRYVTGQEPQPKMFAKVTGAPYKKNLVCLFPQYTERSETFVPTHPVADEIFYHITPFDPNTLTWTKTNYAKLVNGVPTPSGTLAMDAVVPYRLWTTYSLNGDAIVQYGERLFLRNLKPINSDVPPPPPDPVPPTDYRLLTKDELPIHIAFLQQLLAEKSK